VEIALKQRLVGAAVIIALGIIVIPMILDGAGERQLRKMPAEPETTQTAKSGFVIQNKQEISLPEQSASVVSELPKAGEVEKDSVPVDKMPATAGSKAATEKPVKKQGQEAKPLITKKKPVPKAEPAAKKVAKPRPEPAAKKVAKSRPETSQPGKQVVSWVVQVGSFTDAKKAFGLRDNLRKKKYKAFVEKISGRTGQNMYRVRIGPIAKRLQADNMSKKLKTEGVKSFITRHP